MIKCEWINNKWFSCDNCNREMYYGIRYTFSDRFAEYVKLGLCEDCSNALANLHYNVVKAQDSYVYNFDEIKKLV